MEKNQMYTLNINSNLTNLNFHINDINYKNILTEARTCINSESYPFDLDEIVIHVSTRYLKARLLLKDVKVGEILSQKNINLESIKNDLINSKGRRKVNFLSLISKPFDSLICKILNKKLAEKYESIQDELLNKITQLTYQLEEKIKASGINLSISDIKLS